VDENSAPEGLDEATPIFGAYRRGYDPDQVDRYVTDQRRRLDEALHRASEAERRLAAAVGQLRELHRRVAVLESEDRTQQPQPLDTLGERVQRILQEAWDGAYAIRQSVDQEANELRGRAAGEAEEIVAAARRKAESAEEEIKRRRRDYLERIEQERSRTASQMTYLHEQRALALSELNRIKTLLEATVSEVDSGADPRREPRAAIEERGLAESVLADLSTHHADADPVEPPVAERPRPTERPRVMRPLAPSPRSEELPRTMPVHRLDLSQMPDSEVDRSLLVHSHRASDAARRAPVRELSSARERRASASIFDFEAEEPE
jgi:cell division septum initiation protein DivIVA